MAVGWATAAVGGEGQVLLHRSAADAVKGGGGQAPRRGKVVSSGCVSRW